MTPIISINRFVLRWILQGIWLVRQKYGWGETAGVIWETDKIHELLSPSFSDLGFASKNKVVQGSWKAITNCPWLHSGRLCRRLATAYAALKTRHFSTRACWSCTLYGARKAFVTFTVLVNSRRETNKLLSGSVVPVLKYRVVLTNAFRQAPGCTAYMHCLTGTRKRLDLRRRFRSRNLLF